MTAEELVKHFGMSAHPENGAYVEKHYAHPGPGRAASGSIYYYVGATELTEFHVIDCDEYWCYTEGSALEVWLVDASSGLVTVKLLGTDDGCVPLIYIPQGTVFASKHPKGSSEGTFLTCVTVPRFDPAGFTMISRDEMLSRFPSVKEFYE